EALDRCESIVAELFRVDPASSRTSLVAAACASMTHHFDQARHHLAQAIARGAPTLDTRHLALSVDQATGENLDEVLAARQRIADETRSLADLVPLAALLVDLGEFAAAEGTYRQAIAEFHDVSPFPLALACFQLGHLWGECVPDPQPNL